MTAVSIISIYYIFIISNIISFFTLHTDTRLSVRALLETVVAETLVAPFQVNATAVLTEAGVNSALVDILALVRHPYLLVTRWTDAHKGADQILALEPTVVRRCRAFINI